MIEHRDCVHKFPQRYLRLFGKLDKVVLLCARVTNDDYDNSPYEELYGLGWEGTIRYIFERSERFSVPVTKILLTWPQEIIGPLISYIDIDNISQPWVKFGEQLALDVLLEKYFYQLSDEQQKRLDINKLKGEQFSHILFLYLSDEKKISLARKIKPRELDTDELSLIITCLVENIEPSDQILSSEQIAQFDLSRLTLESKLALLKTRGENFCQEQFRSFDMSDVEIAEAVIQNGFLKFLSDDQLRQIKISELSDGAVKKLVNAKIGEAETNDSRVYSRLSVSQIQQINLMLINLIDLNGQRGVGILNSRASDLLDSQIQNVNFGQREQHENENSPIKSKIKQEQILKVLIEKGKSNSLSDDQIKILKPSETKNIILKVQESSQTWELDVPDADVLIKNPDSLAKSKEHARVLVAAYENTKWTVIQIVFAVIFFPIGFFVWLVSKFIFQPKRDEILKAVPVYLEADKILELRQTNEFDGRLFDASQRAALENGQYAYREINDEILE